MKVKVKVIIACILTILATSFAYAKDIHVPGDYDTIQEAIDAAVQGDRVIVAEGTYEENITLKNFVDVLGAAADVTTITSSSGSVVSANKITDRYTKLDGFTIDGQGTTNYGICCKDISNFTISNNIITQNGSYGVFCDNSSPTVSKNTITQSAGGVYCTNDASPIISNNTITQNSSGIHCYSSPTISENRIHSNYRGIHLSSSSSPMISNNTIYWSDYQGIYCDDASSPTIIGNEITRNGYDGIHLLKSSSPPTIENNIITKNSYNGINFSSGSSKVIGNIITDNWMDGIYISDGNPDIGTEAAPGMNSIHDNGGYDVSNQTENTIMAELNWWGQAPPNPAYFSGNIDYDPWLTEPPNPGTGSINGHVKDAVTEEPIPKAIVIAINAETKEKTIDITNADGYYEIPDLEQGIYLVLCIKKGYKPGIKKVEVIAGEETPVPFELSPNPE